MNIGAVALATLRRAPGSVRGAIVLTDKDGNTAKGMGYGVAPSAPANDGLKEGTVVAAKARDLTILPDGLDFPPASGHYCDWAGVRYAVLAAKPFPEIGPPAFYRATVST